MSDALSDIAADERRGRNFASYLSCVKEYLLNPTKENFKKAVEGARNTDSVSRGYWGGRTYLSKDIKNHLKKLQKGDKEEWAKFLSRLRGSSWDYRLQEFKKLSPFKDKFVLFVDYGRGFVTIKGELESLVSQIVRQGKNWKTYDADDYFIAIPKPDVKEAETFWLRCGIMGVNGPREVEK